MDLDRMVGPERPGTQSETVANRLAALFCSSDITQRLSQTVHVQRKVQPAGRWSRCVYLTSTVFPGLSPESLTSDSMREIEATLEASFYRPIIRNDSQQSGLR
ncbi:hypothetical protein RRG08_059392 [Elysia crispata]|uniref:Uncharacterized protein n=1 Tax=Elysia crispata TaxID=231223 RepID=A0AAE1E649_9GAST|nr:hypothetical protein RRG08_059392 [Elysia crispata]